MLIKVHYFDRAQPGCEPDLNWCRGVDGPRVGETEIVLNFGKAVIR